VGLTIIREARLSDVDRVTELFDLLNVDAIPWEYRLTPIYVRALVERRQCYIAQIGGNTVGAIHVRPVVFRGLEVESISVDPAFQGRGVGTLLMRHAATVAVETYGANRLLVGSQDDYDAAEFYLRIGMEEISDRAHNPNARFFQQQLDT